MKKIIVYALILLMTASATIGCGKARERKAKDEAIPVRVMKVERKDLNKILEYVGNITGQDEAIVYPKVSGKIVEKVKEDGSYVRKGEAIAYIDRDEVGLKFEKAPIESPLTGTVGRVYVDIGSSVTPQTAIALIADMTQAEIDVDIPEKYLPKVSLGNKAEITVDAYPEKIFKGQVKKISPVVDIATRTAPIEIVIDNNGRKCLQSGMFTKVKLIIGENKNVNVILKEAVLGKEPDTYVYRVENNKAVLKKVKLGLRQGPLIEVTEGLKEGDFVVIMGQQRLRDGCLVTAEESD